MAKKRQLFGPQPPWARAYVLDFGTCSVTFVYLEEYLRNYVVLRRVLAAKWPLQPKKLEKILNALDEAMLPDLLREYEALTGSSRLVAQIGRLTPKRNAMMHIIPPIFDDVTLAVARRRVEAHRAAFRRTTTQVHAVMLAIEAASEKVFHALEARGRKGPSTSHDDLAVLARMLRRRGERFEKTLRD